MHLLLLLLLPISKPCSLLLFPVASSPRQQLLPKNIVLRWGYLKTFSLSKFWNLTAISACIHITILAIGDWLMGFSSFVVYFNQSRYEYITKESIFSGVSWLYQRTKTIFVFWFVVCSVLSTVYWGERAHMILFYFFLKQTTDKFFNHDLTWNNI